MRKYINHWWWSIKYKNGYISPRLASHGKLSAIQNFLDSIGYSTWKKAYAHGYRVIKIEIKEVKK